MMNEEAICQLLSIAPTSNEQLAAEQRSQHQNVRHFGVVERFFYSLNDIVELKQRLEMWLFSKRFTNKVDKLTNQITIIEKAKLTITLSKELRDIFSILLAFGNHMNYGNKRNQNAYGFLLSDLSLVRREYILFILTMYIYIYILYEYIYSYHVSKPLIIR